MAKQWYEEALAQNPNDGAALAARLKDTPNEDNDVLAKLHAAQNAQVQHAPAWFRNLPKNIGVGAYKAALETIETGADLADALVAAEAQVAASKLDEEGVAPAPEKIELPSVREMAPEFFDGAHRLAAEWTAGNTLGDDIAQGVAQFAIPFAGWMRALGGLKAGATAANVAKGVAAEAVAAATSFSPHEGRMADLIQMGRESEGKFGELLRAVAPDGSLANQYINWMTARENEGEWEGRFKNAVDSVVTTVGLGVLLKGAATGFRAGRQALESAPQTPKGRQRGSVGVPPSDELTDIERARALKNTQVEEGGEHIVLEGDTVNQNADVIPLRPQESK